jgi:hypothetical protein
VRTSRSGLGSGGSLGRGGGGGLGLLGGGGGSLGRGGGLLLGGGGRGSITALGAEVLELGHVLLFLYGHHGRLQPRCRGQATSTTTLLQRWDRVEASKRK